MPQQTTVTERYWCPGWWPWEWFRTCTRTVTKWCYQFQWVKEYRWLLFCYLEGCENGTKYCWYAFCFNVFGSETFFNVNMCFDSQKPTCGNCG